MIVKPPEHWTLRFADQIEGGGSLRCVELRTLIIEFDEGQFVAAIRGSAG
jgi:hypothetical protein